VLVIGHVVTGVTHILGQTRQLQHRTYLGLRLLREVLTVNSAEVVRTLLGNHLDRLETFVNIDLFLIKIFGISCIGVELVSLRVVD
jgi:hypothetical protein